MQIKFKQWTCELQKHEYGNGRTALQLVDAEDGENVTIATVNLPNEPLGEDEVFIKDYSENEGLLASLQEAGIIVPTGRVVQSGFSTVHVCKLVTGLTSPEETRKHHFERLNNYRHSAEYTEFAKSIGAEVPQGELPSLLGDRWEIDEAIYDEFLGMLPPLGWRHGAFFMSEFTFDDITAKFSKGGDKFFCEFARYPERSKPRYIPTETPWGQSQSSHEYAPGIIFHETASHGGFFVSPARVATMPKHLREFKTFAGGTWFEEDVDWSIVALAFPQFFKEKDLVQALSTIKGYKPELYEQEMAARAKDGRGV